MLPPACRVELCLFCCALLCCALMCFELLCYCIVLYIVELCFFSAILFCVFFWIAFVCLCFSRYNTMASPCLLKKRLNKKWENNISNSHSYLAECMSHRSIHTCMVAVPRARIVCGPSRHDYWHTLCYRPHRRQAHWSLLNFALWGPCHEQS